MSTTSITIRNGRKLVELFDRAPVTAAREIREAIKESTLLVDKVSKREAPVDTGFLRSKITPSLRPLTGVVRALTNYAVFVHDGTKHQKANPFFERAAQKSEERINQFFEKAAERITEQLAS